MATPASLFLIITLLATANNPSTWLGCWVSRILLETGNTTGNTFIYIGQASDDNHYDYLDVSTRNFL